MKYLTVIFLAFVVLFSFFAKNTKAQSGNYCVNVPVLMYHHIKPQALAVQAGQTGLNVDNGMFDQQIQYLASHGYRTISALDLVTALRTQAGLPAKSIVLTFDDGYDDIYSYAYPIAKKYDVILNLMIPTGLMNNPGFLTWDQIREMKNSGLVNMYNHTFSHYPLTQGDTTKQEFEIGTAKSQLESQLGVSNNIVTYPFGSFNNVTYAVLQKLKFAAAFSSIGGRTQCNSFILNLHRTRIGNASMNYYGF